MLPTTERTPHRKQKHHSITSSARSKIDCGTLRPSWPIESARAACFMLDPKTRVRPPKLTVEEDRAGDDGGRNAHP
jgi:hypothetical protein